MIKRRRVDLQWDFHSFRNSQRIPTLHVTQHLVVAHSLERKTTERQDLVKQNTVGPYVRGWSEYSKAQGLWRHPSHWQHP